MVRVYLKNPYCCLWLYLATPKLSIGSVVPEMCQAGLRYFPLQEKYIFVVEIPESLFAGVALSVHEKCSVCYFLTCFVTMLIVFYLSVVYCHALAQAVAKRFLNEGAAVYASCLCLLFRGKSRERGIQVFSCS